MHTLREVIGHLPNYPKVLLQRRSFLRAELQKSLFPENPEFPEGLKSTLALFLFRAAAPLPCS